MEIDLKEARRLIMLAIKNNPTGVDYSRLDRAFVNRMPEMIIGGYGNKLKHLLDQMMKEGILSWHVQGYIKGSNFPEDF